MSLSGINMIQPETAFEEEVVYKECRRNHAASLGRVAYDGCHEFLLGRADSNSAENALLCACCGCHRSFHRKHIVFHLMSQTQTENAVVVNNPEVQEMLPKRKKRTMFTPEQRNQMMRFAESVGWKPQKDNKEEIQRFCSEMGISRRMFLVWLSNNRRRAMQNAKASEKTGRTTS